MHEEGIYPEIISGASAGAIAGAMYADGYSPREMLYLFARNNIFKFINISIPKNGLLQISGLKRVLEKHLRAKTFAELKKPLHIAVTNFNKAEAEYISEGNLIDAILASSSIPVLFKPYKMNGIDYIDGGFTDNLPLKPIKNLCKEIIGVHVNPVGIDEKPRGIIHIATRSFHTSIAINASRKKNSFKYYIEPQELQNFGYLDISEATKIYKIGYRETKKELAIKSESVRKT